MCLDMALSRFSRISRLSRVSILGTPELEVDATFPVEWLDRSRWQIRASRPGNNSRHRQRKMGHPTLRSHPRLSISHTPSRSPRLCPFRWITSISSIKLPPSSASASLYSLSSAYSLFPPKLTLQLTIPSPPRPTLAANTRNISNGPPRGSNVSFRAVVSFASRLWSVHPTCRLCYLGFIRSRLW